MGMVMERWCPTQPVLGVFLMSDMSDLEGWIIIIVIIGSIVAGIYNGLHPSYDSGDDDRDPSCTHARYC